MLSARTIHNVMESVKRSNQEIEINAQYHSRRRTITRMIFAEEVVIIPIG
jgi:hypothetical protein